MNCVNWNDITMSLFDQTRGNTTSYIRRLGIQVKQIPSLRLTFHYCRNFFFIFFCKLLFSQMKCDGDNYTFCMDKHDKDILKVTSISVYLCKQCVCIALIYFL